MKSYRSLKRGFTLVEILIVVIILGILAAIVIPQFTNASTEARESSVRSQLQTLRSQIELWKLNHGDTIPDLTANWDDLTTVTTWGGENFGPYLQQVPVNALNSLSNVFDGPTNANAGAAAGFIYDFTGGTGRLAATDTDGTTLFAE